MLLLNQINRLFIRFDNTFKLITIFISHNYIIKINGIPSHKSIIIFDLLRYSVKNKIRYHIPYNPVSSRTRLIPGRQDLLS